MAASVRVYGLGALRENLAALGEAVERKVLARATRAAAAHVLEAAKARAPRGGGKKKNSAGTSIGHMAETLVVEESKSKRGVVTQKIGSYWHGSLLHLVEFGTAPHEIQVPIARGGKGFGKSGRLVQAYRTVKHPGSAARPFLRPAIDAGGAKAIQTFSEEMAKGIARELKRRGWHEAQFAKATKAKRTGT